MSEVIYRIRLELDGHEPGEPIYTTDEDAARKAEDAGYTIAKFVREEDGEANPKPPVIHGAPVEVGQLWRYKSNRGFGSFHVKGVVGPRITLKDSWNGKIKTVSAKTLSGDFERVAS